MRKLQHQHSCNLALDQLSTNEDEQRGKLRQTELSGGRQEVRVLEGKILLLEERGKSIQQFYENKIAQLKAVLLKQSETRCELTQQLQRLTQDSHRQGQLVQRLKGQLQEERLNVSLRAAKEAVQNYEPSGEKYSVRKGSRGKGCLLFNSNNLRDLSRNRTALRKCRSEQYLQSQYFTESQGSLNPEGMRRQ